MNTKSFKLIASYGILEEFASIFEPTYEKVKGNISGSVEKWKLTLNRICPNFRFQLKSQPYIMWFKIIIVTVNLHTFFIIGKICIIYSLLSIFAFLKVTNWSKKFYFRKYTWTLVDIVNYQICVTLSKDYLNVFEWDLTMCTMLDLAQKCSWLDPSTVENSPKKYNTLVGATA